MLIQILDTERPRCKDRQGEVKVLIKNIYHKKKKEEMSEQQNGGKCK